MMSWEQVKREKTGKLGINPTRWLKLIPIQILQLQRSIQTQVKGNLPTLPTTYNRTTDLLLLLPLLYIPSSFLLQTQVVHLLVVAMEKLTTFVSIESLKLENTRLGMGMLFS